MTRTAAQCPQRCRTAPSLHVRGLCSNLRRLGSRRVDEICETGRMSEHPSRAVSRPRGASANESHPEPNRSRQERDGRAERVPSSHLVAVLAAELGIAPAPHPRRRGTARRRQLRTLHRPLPQRSDGRAHRHPAARHPDPPEPATRPRGAPYPCA